MRRNTKSTSPGHSIVTNLRTAGSKSKGSSPTANRSSVVRQQSKSSVGSVSEESEQEDTSQLQNYHARYDVSDDVVRVVRGRRRDSFGVKSMLALGFVHFALFVIVGVHNRWSWSVELLRLVTDLSFDAADVAVTSLITSRLTQTKWDDYQNVSLRSPYYLDWRRVTSQRERNMRLYNYSYDVNGVDKRTNLSLQEFRDVYDGKWPVIIQDVVPTWKASNWTREFLCTTYGQERVVMKGVRGGLETAETMALPLELFCQHLSETHPLQWTYVEDELFLPTRQYLRSDVGESIYTKDDLFRLFPAEVRPWDAMLLWGTAYSRSSLHIDPYNWTGTNAVIHGRKRWKLFPPGQDHLLLIKPKKLSNFPLNCYKYNSIVDMFDEHRATRFPLTSQARYLEVDQLPGELMIIPTGWFHQAFNVEETLAVSGQLANVNNYRVVLEEILKLEQNLQRASLQHRTRFMSPSEQVSLVMSLLSPEVLHRGRKVTQDSLAQIKYTESRPSIT